MNVDVINVTSKIPQFCVLQIYSAAKPIKFWRLGGGL